MRVPLFSLLIAIGVSMALSALGGSGRIRHLVRSSDSQSENAGSLPSPAKLSSRRIPTQEQPYPIWESPRIRQGLIIGVESAYHDFVEQMNLKPEEGHYFYSLLSERSLQRGTHDLQWARANHDSQETIDHNLEIALAENSGLIQQFLNNETDFDLFLKYESELPERRALAPFQSYFNLTSQQEEALIELMTQARLETETEYGYQFEKFRFLCKYQDFDLLKILRAEADLKIESGLRAILDARQSEVFWDKWKSIREEQLQHSEFTAKLIKKDNS